MSADKKEELRKKFEQEYKAAKKLFEALPSEEQLFITLQSGQYARELVKEGSIIPRINKKTGQVDYHTTIKGVQMYGKMITPEVKEKIDEELGITEYSSIIHPIRDQKEIKAAYMNEDYVLEPHAIFRLQDMGELTAEEVKILLQRYEEYEQQQENARKTPKHGKLWPPHSLYAPREKLQVVRRESPDLADAYELFWQILFAAKHDYKSKIRDVETQYKELSDLKEKNLLHSFFAYVSIATIKEKRFIGNMDKIQPLVRIGYDEDDVLDYVYAVIPHEVAFVADIDQNKIDGILELAKERGFVRQGDKFPKTPEDATLNVVVKDGKLFAVRETT
jgi:hypothetical protein